MKVEYVTSPIGGGTELYISAAEYKRVNSKDGWSDRQNLMFAVRSYTQTNQSRNKIKSRDLEEAFRHIKKDGTIVQKTEPLFLQLNWPGNLRGVRYMLSQITKLFRFSQAVTVKMLTSTIQKRQNEN